MQAEPSTAQPPLISVVIPAFNAQPFLEGAVKSALGQEGVTIEVILIDDASTDETWSLMEKISNADARVRLARQPTNQGPSAARNLAIEMARGSWIALLDADDRFAGGRLQLLARLGDELAADFIADNQQLTDEDTGAPLGYAFPMNWTKLDRQLSVADLGLRDMPGENARLPIGYIKPMIRREFLIAHQLRYRTEYRLGEDFFLYLEALIAGARIWVCAAAGYLATVRASSLSRDDDEIPARLLEMNARARALIADRPAGERRVFERRHRALRMEVAKSLLHRGMRVEAAKQLLRLGPIYFAERLLRAAVRRTRGREAS